MNALRDLALEIAGLFVEDRLFALAIAGCIVAAYALSATNAVPPVARGALLFAALAATLIGGVLRGARTR